MDFSSLVKAALLTGGVAVAAMFTGSVLVDAQNQYEARAAVTPHCYLVAFERHARQWEPVAATTDNKEVCVPGLPGSRVAVTAIQKQLKTSLESDRATSFVILNIMHLGEHYATRNRTKISG